MIDQDTSDLAQLFISLMAGLALVALLALLGLALVPFAKFLYRCHERGAARVRSYERTKRSGLGTSRLTDEHRLRAVSAVEARAGTPQRDGRHRAFTVLWRSADPFIRPDKEQP